jgi:hypothetical protein
MTPHSVTLRDGTTAEMHQSACGLWACPICGSVELDAAPYSGDGATSFEMCSCGFEFGFDDDPGASAEANPSVQVNWSRWRERFLSRFRAHPAALAEVAARLEAIGVKVERNNAL